MRLRTAHKRRRRLLEGPQHARKLQRQLENYFFRNLGRHIDQAIAKDEERMNSITDASLLAVEVMRCMRDGFQSLILEMSSMRPLAQSNV